jgi:hypothetical protein
MARATQPKVGFEDHPLCSDPEESEGSDGEEPPSDADKSAPSSAPERSTRSTARTARDLEEGSEGEGLSDRDEAMSEGESSYGDDPQFLGPPDLQQLVCLGQEHCRTPCRLTNNAGVKVAGICGQKVKDCKRQASKRLGSSNYQHGIGSYPPVLVSRGFTGHGLASGPCYTDSQVRAFQSDAAKEMTLLVDTMNEDGSDGGEMEELSRDVRVKFVSPTPAPVKNKPSASSTTYDLRKALAASSGGPSKKKKSPPAPVLWFGMVGKQGMRWITSNPMEAHNTISKKHCRIEKVFQTQAEAEAWLDEEEPMIPALIPRDLSQCDSSDSEDEDDSSVSEADKASAKANRLKKKKQNRKARKKKESKEAKAKTKKKSRKPEPRRPPNKGRHKSDDESDPSESSEDSDSSSSHSDPSSSSSSSNDDSSSDSASSSSDDSSAKRPSRRQSKKKKKPNRKPSKKPSKKEKSGKKGKKNSTNYHKFQHEDPSTGDSQRIYGMSINGITIDKEVSPDSMRRTDRGAMYAAAVDVTSLPGGWNSNKGVSEELFQETQKMAQLTQTIMASTNKLQGMEIQDTSWNSTIRHSLGKVKNREDLFEFVKKLRKSKKAAFKQETNLIQHFMYLRHYNGSFIREYSRSSLLSLITKRSFKSFFDLGDAVRQLAFDHGQWEGGPAKSMLLFHSEKLMEIRQFAVSRKQLILQIYTYLRDAQAKDFYHESMAGAIWERIGSLQMATPAQVTPGNGSESKCSWCASKDLHKLFNLMGQRNLCPVKALPDKSKAKEAAKSIVDQKRADPTKDIQELLAGALTQFV